ncbi:MAG: hypothetical protein C5B43_01880, partial [Verrucomicrobia bacterium]
LKAKADSLSHCFVTSKFQKQYPNLFDLFSLFSDTSFKKGDCADRNIDFKNEILSIKETKDEIQADSMTLNLIFHEELTKYRDFLSKNDEVLRNVEDVMNSKNLRKRSKQCVIYKSKERCTENAIKEFVSLRELMEYVQTM